MDLIIRELEGRVDKTYHFHEIDTLADQSGEKRGRNIVFVTGNKNKIVELGDHVKTKLAKFSVLDMDLPEIQSSNVLNIVEEKCRNAFKQVNKTSSNHGDNQSKENCSVLIEDTCLSFNALNGMPGPYIKWFLKAVGPSGLHKMLAGFEDKTAEATCIYALMDGDSKIVFCKGSVRGKITEARGSSGWGWDPIFEEERSGMTFGEMDLSMKFKFSHRSNALTVLKKYLSLGQLECV